MHQFKNIFYNIVRRLWDYLRTTHKVENVSNLWAYPSYWKYKLLKSKDICIDSNQYFTAIPNRGAGIGHQISNWQAGLWWSWQFGLKHANVPFSQKSWDRFLGYGVGDPLLSDLKMQGYKIVRLPLFHECDSKEMQLIKKIISCYFGKKIVFLAEQDQSYMAQYGVMDYIRYKFYNNPVRLSDVTPYKDDTFNIAIHIRRGDIVIGQCNGDPNLTMRWLNNTYYSSALNSILQRISTNKPIHIYVFSQGNIDDFPELKGYKNVHFYLDLNPECTFLSFVYADVLITSKSSFSYKPALLNMKGIKVCPANFWHQYPKSEDWVLMDDNGDLFV